MNIKTPQYIPIAFDPADHATSVSRLIYALFPQWKQDGEIQFVQLTGGLTNASLKVVNKRTELSKEQIEKDAVILRIYGNGTDVLTDREREWKSHCLLAHHNLAPQPLARFKNGFIYRYIVGRVCSLGDLRQERIWRSVARTLGKWHGAVVIPDGVENSSIEKTLPSSESCESSTSDSIWTLAAKWISALPITTSEERARKTTLQRELYRVKEELSDIQGIGSNKLVFGHCDLLSGNVIVHPHEDGDCENDGAVTVTFIDYEYALPCPAAFDLSNHFSEWAGFECDYNLLPTRSIRRAFLREYVCSFREHSKFRQEKDLEEQVEQLFDEVDRFRGISGFFWAICAFIQAMDPQTEFDHASYGKLRLAEYWAWRASEDGTRTSETELPLRERKWAQEA